MQLVATAQGATPVVKEATEDTVRASQIVGGARVAEALGAASIVKEAVKKAVESPERPDQLNQCIRGSCSERS